MKNKERAIWTLLQNFNIISGELEILEEIVSLIGGIDTLLLVKGTYSNFNIEFHIG